MRRFKKVVAVALAATMATGLMAGCGSKTAATTSASTEAAEVATEEQETKVEKMAILFYRGRHRRGSRSCNGRQGSGYSV